MRPDLPEIRSTVFLFLAVIAAVHNPDQRPPSVPPGEPHPIRFNDRDVTYAPANKRDVGLVFQNYALFPHMSVAKNVRCVAPVGQ